MWRYSFYWIIDSFIRSTFSENRAWWTWCLKKFFSSYWKVWREKMCYTYKKSCFAKCVKFLTGWSVTNEYKDKKISFDRRKLVMCQARTLWVLKKANIFIRSFNRKQILPTSFKIGKKCLYLHRQPNTAIRKSEAVSLLKTSQEVKKNYGLQAAHVDSDGVRQYVNYFNYPKKRKSTKYYNKLTLRKFL